MNPDPNTPANSSDPQSAPQQPYGQQPPQYGVPQQPYGQQPPQYGMPQQPYGSPPQPPKKKRWGLWIILAIVALLFVGCVAAVAGGGDEQATVVDNNGSSSADSESAASLDFPGKSSKDTGADAGATVDKKGVQITAAPLESAERSYGGSLLCTNVTIVNGTDKQQRFNGYFDWKLQDPNGVSKDATFVTGRSTLESGELAPGGRVAGDVCFDDPAASGQYVVLMETLLSFDSSRIGWINQI
ncbi:DUF4352 domain-containing protein [Rhodococcus qingshengii]|uniref:DUF4352 domain-containing protein n=1 Tax=Rhodococcus qingshengii TaxID=334542 RepID=UPI001AE3DA38|nr:DUF4352 domain-containing protein [Rhodococcus qingshengii]MBP1054544.1 DUF4352 domain-containing protein [Rhodococcus qingshengii]